LFNIAASTNSRPNHGIFPNVSTCASAQTHGFRNVLDLSFTSIHEQRVACSILRVIPCDNLHTLRTLLGAGYADIPEMKVPLPPSTLSVRANAFVRWSALLLGDPCGLCRWRVCLFAMLATMLTLGLSIPLMRSLEGPGTLVLFMLPITCSAYAGGLRAGLLATALTVFLASCFSLPPMRWAASPSHWELFLVALAGLVISGSNEALHRARCRAVLAGREQQGTLSALRESEEKFRHLADNIHDALWIASPDLNTIHFTSAGYEAIWRRTPASLHAYSQEWVDTILRGSRGRPGRFPHAHGRRAKGQCRISDRPARWLGAPGA
jgi:PAS domain-containing protein